MQSLSRALTVLAELNRQDRAYGVTELAVAVGLHKSTVHRILATFCEHGLARRLDDHLYSAADGLAALRTAPPQPGPGQLLTALSNKLDCLVVLATPLRRTTGTVLEVTAVAGEGGRGEAAAAAAGRGGADAARGEVRPGRGGRVDAGRGEVRPGCAVSLRGSALGRAYLSALPVDEVDGTPDLHEALRRIRETGFAHNARQVASLPRMVAVPVHDAAGRCTGALGAELTQPISIDQIRRVVPALRRAAHHLTPGRRAIPPDPGEARLDHPGEARLDHPGSGRLDGPGGVRFERARVPATVERRRGA